jgi:hypothetical protein
MGFGVPSARQVHVLRAPRRSVRLDAPATREGRALSSTGHRQDDRDPVAVGERRPVVRPNVVDRVPHAAGRSGPADRFRQERPQLCRLGTAGRSDDAPVRAEALAQRGEHKDGQRDVVGHGLIIGPRSALPSGSNYDIRTTRRDRHIFGSDTTPGSRRRCLHRPPWRRPPQRQLFLAKAKLMPAFT